MWKVSFEFLKWKIYRLSEADSCHKLGCLDIWFRSLIKSDYKCICGCCKQSYCEREWTSHTKQKSTKTPNFIVSALSYSLAANITCYPQTALHRKYYIFKCHSRRKISPPRMLEPHWLKSEAITIVMEAFKNKTSGGGCERGLIEYHHPPPFY